MKFPGGVALISTENQRMHLSLRPYPPSAQRLLSLRSRRDGGRHGVHRHAKRVAVADGSDHCAGDDRPDPGNRHQPFARGSKLSRYGLARAQYAARLGRRPALTAPARAGSAILRVGAKKRDTRWNKETDQEMRRAETA
jgi:hypothetical protein